jgi:hypothetical protein
LVVLGLVVAAGLPVGVDPGRWQEFGSSVVGDADVPAVVVHDSVVVVAKQGEVVQIRWPVAGQC